MRKQWAFHAAAVLAMTAIFITIRGAGHDNAGATIPSPYSHFASAVTVTENGSNVQLWASAVPDHKSPYFLMGDPRYEAYNGSNPNWQQNPNHIGTQSLLFTIPENPQEATVHQATPLGPIGIAINGVPFFNQYAGPSQPLTNEINSFDQYNGHPQQENMYHYHTVPSALITQYGSSALLGYLLDGFPVYGPVENGVTLTSADLDQYHGHFGPTPDYPNGIYHYNITADAPYINGVGFYGTPGTVVLNAPTPVITATPTASPTPTATPTASPSPTPTATPAPTPTPTPPLSTGDSDGDGIIDALDNCPNVINANQANSDGDTIGNACDNCFMVANQDQANTDGDEYGDACEQAQCVTVINHWIVPAGDSDCDGWTDVRESFSGTLTNQKCMTTPGTSDEPDPDAWPVDFNDDQLSNGQDVLKFNPTFGTVAPGGPGSHQYSVRFDLNGDGIINGQDILRFNSYFGKFCSP